MENFISMLFRSGRTPITVTDASFCRARAACDGSFGSGADLAFRATHGVSQNQSVTVSAEAAPGQTESVTPTTLIDREEIQQTPGAARTNSLAMITELRTRCVRHTRSASCARRASGELAD